MVTKCSVMVYGGRLVDPMDPNPEDLVLTELAGSLAGICRFNGALRQHYSVAQHSVIVAHCVLSMGGGIAAAQAALLHDLSEALTGDMVWPLKRHTPAGPPLIAIEDRLMAVLRHRFGISWTLEIQDIVDLADKRVLLGEVRDLCDDPPWAADRVGGEGIYPYPESRFIIPEPRDRAHVMFMGMANVLGIRHG